MIHFRKVDKDGLFERDEFLDFLPYTEDGEPDPEYITDPLPEDAKFWRPRWNGEAWEEGGAAPEPPEAQPVEQTPDERIASVEDAVEYIITILEGLA